MKHTILTLAFALIASGSICSSLFAGDSEEFTYGLKTDKMIIPMTEESQPAMSFSMPMNHFNGYTFHHAAPSPFMGGFYGGFGYGMASAPMAFVPNHFNYGFGHF